MPTRLPTISTVVVWEPDGGSNRAGCWWFSLYTLRGICMEISTPKGSPERQVVTSYHPLVLVSDLAWPAIGLQNQFNKIQSIILNSI